MSAAVAAAFAGGALAALAAAESVRAGLPVALDRGPRLARAVAALADAVARAGSEGRDPGAAERRRLLAAGAALAFVAGTALAGVVPGLAVAAGGPWAVARVLGARREHYRRAVDAGAAAAALALADALAAGHSLRGAIAEAAGGVDGQVGHELRRTAAELAAGARTAAALEDLRARTRAPRLDTLVAACLVQSGAGGDLAGVLRDCAEGFADQARVEDDARAATAQARFTGVIVVLLPLGGGLLAELASPGFAAGLLSSLLTAWLVGVAVAMQLLAAYLVRRLGRVRV